MNEERRSFAHIEPGFLDGSFYECRVIDPPNIDEANPPKCLFQIIDDVSRSDLRLWYHEAERLHELLGLALGKGADHG
jgi:hypothetical protein